MTEPHSLAGAYVLHALPEQEARLFERHLEGCADCRDEVDGLRATAARLAEPAAVPDGMRDAVLGRVARTRQLPPHIGSARARRWTRGIAAAAIAAVLALLLVLVLPDRHGTNDGSQLSEQINAVLAASDATSSSADVVGGGTFSVVASPSLAQAVVTIAGLPPAEADRIYELWVIRASDARAAGLTPHGTQILVDDVVRDDILGLTIEPAGGSSQPTTAPIVTVTVS